MGVSSSSGGAEGDPGPATPDAHSTCLRWPIQGWACPLPMSPQLTGQVPLRSIFLPPNRKFVNLELPVIRHVLILIPHWLGLVLLEVLQGSKHPWAWLWLEGLGAGAAEVGRSVDIHTAWLVPPAPPPTGLGGPTARLEPSQPHSLLSNVVTPVKRAHNPQGVCLALSRAT